MMTCFKNKANEAVFFTVFVKAATLFLFGILALVVVCGDIEAKTIPPEAVSGRADKVKTCPSSLEPPAVSVSIEQAEPRFETQRPVSHLNNLGVETDPPYPSTYHDEVAGATESIIHVDHKIQYKTVTDKRFDVACLWFDKVEITFRVHPKIYIAEEYNKDSCWFREIFLHENKHMQADVAVLQDHVDFIKRGLGLMFLYRIDFVSGLSDQKSLERRFAEMKWSLRQALGVLFDVVMQERAKRHQAIDSVNDYMMVGRKCGAPYRVE